MKYSPNSRFLILGTLLCLYCPSAFSSILHPLIANSTYEHMNYTAISGFRVVNRRELVECKVRSPYIKITAAASSSTGVRLLDEDYITVTITGVLVPADDDWVAMMTPSNADATDCALAEAYYLQTGDTASLPLLCQYPVKAQYVKNDPKYLNCQTKQCQDHFCLTKTCGASLTFHVVNFRTDIEFVFFEHGFAAPCILARSNILSFANPNSPLHGLLSSIDSTATSMRLTWVSGDGQPQQVQYGNGQTVTSQVTTFTQNHMCSGAIPSPAKDFGWHNPGYIHTAVMTQLHPSTGYSYKYGSSSVGWSSQVHFKTPPAAGSSELRFLPFGDMGKAPLDPSLEHYIQPGSISVSRAISDEVASGNVDSVFHIGDISYATGFLVEWDFFLSLINPIASRVSYMTAIGNHERDYIDSGSVYITPDSGGECGVAYETYFPMPTSAKDKPWYSIEQGPVHFTVISTEHDWSQGSEQYQWIIHDLPSVDRSRTPWLVFMGHRPMYTSASSGADSGFTNAVEPLLLQYKVDLALFGHVHNYERTCAVYQGNCKAIPTNVNGVATYDSTTYTAPVHAIIGMAGFSLDSFTQNNPWSLARISQFGYARAYASTTTLKIELVNATTRAVLDSFQIKK